MTIREKLRTTTTGALAGWLDDLLYDHGFALGNLKGAGRPIGETTPDVPKNLRAIFHVLEKLAIDEITKELGADPSDWRYQLGLQAGKQDGGKP